MEAENKQTMTTQARLIKVVLNDEGDHIAISTDDLPLLDRYIAGLKRIGDMTDEMPGKLEKIEKKYQGMKGQSSAASTADRMLETARLNIAFSEEVISIFEGVFGEGVLKKYFRKLYDEVPDFMPEAECFTDFIQKMTPVMEKLFGRKIDVEPHIYSASRYRSQKPNRSARKKRGRKN